ncbi:MAG: hypothetical protein C0469_07875 [Cyanobacteria bacterium DS2.3.42]|nr:hypothetical protein [Cyanobacteria bacterium DS2.3.42]
MGEYKGLTKHAQSIETLEESSSAVSLFVQTSVSIAVRRKNRFSGRDVIPVRTLGVKAAWVHAHKLIHHTDI